MSNQRLRWTRVAAVAIAATTVLIAEALLLAPLHVNGVSGSALMPHYSEHFAVATFGPLPRNATFADLRRAGVRLPRDVVAHRRHLAYLVVGFGAALVAICVAAAARATPGAFGPSHSRRCHQRSSNRLQPRSAMPPGPGGKGRLPGAVGDASRPTGVLLGRHATTPIRHADESVGVEFG